MKPTKEQIAKAVWRMSVIPYFPAQNDVAIDTLQQSIEAFVSDTEQLNWLTLTACNVMREFSLAELRGIFCTRFTPADGIYVSAQSPGWRPDEVRASAEQAYIEREGREYREKLSEWKREKLLTGEIAGPASFPALPAGANRMKPAPFVPEPDNAERRARFLDAEANLEEQKRRIPVRTEEEKARLIRELEEKLGIAQKTARPQPGV